MSETFSLATFLRKYKDDNACLKEIFAIKYPEGVYCKTCKKITNFTRVKNRPVYQCACGHQISPLAGTIFEKSTTPLQYWFYAMFVVSNTRSGVSAKALQRELGVTYKTAWRMMKQIRMLMAESGGGMLEGVVEVDETYVGGKGRNRRFEWRQLDEKPKQILMGMVQRGGKVYIKHIPNTGKWTLLNQIKHHVDPKARIVTDEYPSYHSLYRHGFDHESVNHKSWEYVRGDVHTQNIENVWSHFKRGIKGVYRIVSAKYLQAYADEYAFRYNHRKEQPQMFNLLLGQVTHVSFVK